jgi:hypothetical protein
MKTFDEWFADFAGDGSYESLHAAWDAAIASAAEAEKAKPEPVAWLYDLATAYDSTTQAYCGWVPRVTTTKPSVPEGSIKDEVPLYLHPAPIPPDMAKDAARYRHMRKTAQFQDRNGPGLYWYLPRFMEGDEGEQLDASIDSAMEQCHD